MKNTSKRILSIGLCVLLLLVPLCGCQEKQLSNDNVATTTVAGSASTTTVQPQDTTTASNNETVNTNTQGAVDNTTATLGKGTTVFVTTSTTVADSKTTKNTTSTTVSTTATTKTNDTQKPATITPLTPLSPDAYYGYTLLKNESNAAALQAAYTRVVQSVEKMESTIDLSDLPKSLTKAECSKVWNYYLLDYPHHFWVNGGCSIRTINNEVVSIDVTYLMNKSDRDAAKVEFDAVVNEILSKVSGSWSEYERELAVHDALCERLTYKRVSDKSFTAYGALVEKTAVCEGYAESFQYLMYQCGIQCLAALGEAGGGPHKWNVIRIDGQYYHIDVTWDDPVSETPVILHDYFNLTESFMKRDHTIETKDVYPLPVCNADKANYFKMKGGWLETLDQATVVAALKKTGGKAELHFPNHTSQQFCDWFSDCWRDIFKAAGFGGKGYSMQYSDHGAKITVK